MGALALKGKLLQEMNRLNRETEFINIIVWNKKAYGLAWIF